MITETFNQKSEVEVCKEAVCHVFGLGMNLMNSRCRQAHISWPRQMAMALAMAKTRSTLKFVGECFGRDHGTVIHARDTVNNLIEVDGKAARQWLAVFNEFDERFYGSRTLLEVATTG